MSPQGATILINYHSDKKRTNETLKKVENNSSTGLVFQADVSEYEQMKEMFKTAQSKLRIPWILINNTGIDSSGKTLDEIDIALFDRTIRTSLYGIFYNCKEFIKIRKAEVGNGKIVNITSVLKDIHRAGAAEYCASKGAIGNLARFLAFELEEFNINVNNQAQEWN